MANSIASTGTIASTVLYVSDAALTCKPESINDLTARLSVLTTETFQLRRESSHTPSVQ